MFFLLNIRGSDMEAKDAEGNTPLLTAALHEQDSIIRILLNSGASIAALNRNDHTAVHLAATKANCTSLKVNNSSILV